MCPSVRRVTTKPLHHIKSDAVRFTSPKKASKAYVLRELRWKETCLSGRN
jgi:hypothetical protein